MFELTSCHVREGICYGNDFRYGLRGKRPIWRQVNFIHCSLYYPSGLINRILLPDAHHLHFSLRPFASSTDPNHSPGSILLQNIDLPRYPSFGRNVVLFDESCNPAASLTIRFSGTDCPFNCNILQGKFFDMHRLSSLLL